MSTPRDCSSRSPRNWRNAGFTLVELIVYVVITSTLVGAIMPVMVTQMRSFAEQGEILDARQSVREVAGLMSWELRQISAAEADIYYATPDSVAIRGVRGEAVVCAKHPTLPRYGLAAVSGSIGVADSAVVFAAGGPSPSDDAWLPVRVDEVTDPTSGGVPYCMWGDSVSVLPSAVITVSADTASVRVGAPLRTFRPVQYAPVSQDGRWWLGRREAAASWEIAAGPLRPPTSGGLTLSYFDKAGAATTDPTAVDVVEVAVQSESTGKARRQGSSQALNRTDSVRVRVHPRG